MSRSTFSSVQFSHSVVSDSLRPPWITAGQPSLSIINSRSLPKLMSIESVMPSSLSSSVVPFYSCPQSLPASESFPMSQLFIWDGQKTETSKFGAEKDLLQSHARTMDSSCLPNPELPKGFQQSIFKGKVVGDMTSCCKQISWCWNPFSCSWPYRSGSNVPANFQEDIICNF